MNLKRKPVGNSGIALVGVVVGANVFGWTADQKASFEILDRLLDVGLTSIDTADVYSRWHPGNKGGESECIIGQWMEQRGVRHRIELITKVGMDAGLSPQHIERAVEASLKRLRTDYIDIYFSHRFDPAVPQEQTLSTYERLIRAGKVRCIGASNFNAAQVQQALSIAEQQNLPRYQILQPEYSLMERTSFEGQLCELAIKEGLAVITYYSLASGFLSGKYRSKLDLSNSPRGAGVGKYINSRGLRVLACLDAIAQEHRVALAAVALSWLMARPGVTAPIASASKVQQVDALVAALQLELSPQDMALLTEASDAIASE